MYSTSTLPCVVCSSTSWLDAPDETRIIRARSGFSVVRCASCGLSRLDPMPSQEQLRSFYEDDSLKHEYIRQNSSAYVAGAEQAEAYIIERLQELSGRLGGPGKILDIGAAQGAFLKQAREQQWDAAGLELSTEGVAEAKSLGLDIQQKTLAEAAFKSDSFDVVHMSHVLEHLPDPIETLNEIHRILRPGGLLAVEVPNEFNDLFGTLRHSLLRRPRLEYVVRSPHVYFYTPRTVKRLIENQGYRTFHWATPRRNASISSSFPGGALIRRTVFTLESRLLRGPLIEVYAEKSVSG